MTVKTIFAAAVAVLLSAAPVWAQSITPMSAWVPHIDRTAAAMRGNTADHVDMTSGTGMPR